MVNINIWRKPSSWKQGKTERKTNMTQKDLLNWEHFNAGQHITTQHRISGEGENKPGTDACSCRETPCWGRCCWSYWSWRTRWAARWGWSRPVFAACRSNVIQKVILMSNLIISQGLKEEIWMCFMWLALCCNSILHTEHKQNVTLEKPQKISTLKNASEQLDSECVVYA